jgi:hypothetical protein
LEERNELVIDSGLLFYTAGNR